MLTSGHNGSVKVKIVPLHLSAKYAEKSRVDLAIPYISRDTSNGIKKEPEEDPSLG